VKFICLIFAVFISASLTGCSYQYTAQMTNQIAQAAEFKPRYDVARMRQISILPTHKACFAAAKSTDTQFQQQYEQLLMSHLQSHFAVVVALTEVASERNGLAKAYEQNCDVFIFPDIINRTDKAWGFADSNDSENGSSGIGMDRLALGITVWDVNSTEVLDRAVISSRSAWLDLTASNSVDLLDDSIQQYFQQLVAAH